MMKAKSAWVFLFFLLYYSCFMVSTLVAEPYVIRDNGKGIFSNGNAGQCYVLLVGVDYYDDFAPLHFCGTDMEAMQECFLKMGIPQENITLLVDSPGARDQARPLTLHSPTKENIIRALDNIFKRISKDDVLFIAFSGHGVRLDVKQSSGEPLRISCFCPRDAKYRCECPEETMISVPWLYGMLERSPARFKMLLVDACRNSIVPQGERAPVPKSVGQMDQLSLGQNLPKATIVLVSCKSGQKSYEDPEIQHGLFSYYFTKGLTGAADSDKSYGNQDGRINYNELVGYLNHYTTTHANMMKNRQPQNPVDLTGGQEFDDFVLSEVQRPVLGTPPLYYTNAIGMKFKKVTASSIKIKDASGNVRTLKASEDFFLGRFEVTQQQYTTVAGVNPSGFVDKDSRVCASWPVENISWQDAKNFVDKLNKTLPMCSQLEFGDDWEYTLPVSTDWEYAFFCGIKPDGQGVRDCSPILDHLDLYAWYDKNSKAQTHPVGEKTPVSDFYDMLGNVAEWCAEDYFVQNAEKSSSTKILKGGNWNQSFNPKYVFNPAYVLPVSLEGNGKNQTGFRVAIKRKSKPGPTVATSPESPSASMVSDGQDKSARKLDISPLPRSSAPGSPQNLPEPQQEPPGATKSFSPSATPDESAAPRIVEEPDAKATLAAIPYAVFNESYDHPLRIYRKNPIREDCDYIADIITLLPRGTYSFGKPGDDVHDIYIQKSTDDWARYKLHETKMIGFSYDAEKFRWDASYTK